MRKTLKLAALAAAIGLVAAVPVRAAVENMEPPERNWSFNGPFGTVDKASAQRGYQVFHDVCSNCHSLRQGFLRNLMGLGLSEAQVKAIAASTDVADIGDDGQPITRPGVPSDRFKSPFPNERAARAAMNGALPPDLSVIIKAREGGADYVYALLTGYGEPPPGMKMGDGMNYNRWFPGHQIAMAQPLTDGRVEYPDGTKATMQQEAQDVVQFLTYIANPEMEERKRIGVRIMLFLAFMTGLTYAVKREIWSKLH